MTAADLAPRKDHKQENFPVASFIIKPRHRAVVMAFYRFARTADDIADHPSSPPEEKLDRLERMCGALAGETDDDAAALALRQALRARGLSAAHPLDDRPRARHGARMKLPLSVLDLSPVGAGVAPSQAIRDSIALARTADALGYTRYWFAEHHNMASIATSAPEVLIAYCAAVTKRIRLGAGGIMVPNHSPLHVVELFRTLEALAPGRIDHLGHREPYFERVRTTPCASPSRWR